MKVAFLFPGQGARNLLAGLALARSWPQGAKLVELAANGVDLEANAGRAFERTEVLQPVLTAISLAVYQALEVTTVSLSPAGERASAAVILGHSLGELPAFAAAGVITDEAAVKLAALRGQLMAREAAKHPGGLIALRSLEEAKGHQLAAINAPDEVIVSGTEAALRGLRGTRVPVSGPWHSQAMQGAVDEFRAALRALEPQPAKFPLIRNLDGALGHSLDTLADQLTRPVHFVAALNTAVAQGIDTFVTIGPGAVLRGLLRRNLGTTVRILTTEDAHDFDRTRAILSLPA